MSESKNELNGCFNIGCAIWVLFLIVIVPTLFSVSLGSCHAKNEQKTDDRLKTLSGKRERTEKEWEELNEILKSKYIGSDDECVRNAIANKDWRMLELLKKNHVSFKRDSLISCMNKKSLYSAEDVARLFAIADRNIDIDDVIEAHKAKNYKLALRLLQYLPNYKKTDDSQSYLSWIDAPMLRTMLQEESIDRNQALKLLGEKIFHKSYSDNDWELFKELLRWKKENSKVWTLY